jgi:type II secretory pathway component PulK
MQILIKNPKGFALPLVLGITAIILVLVLTISDSVSRKISVTNELVNHAKAELKAFSGLNQAVFDMLVSTYRPTGLMVHASGTSLDISLETSTTSPQTSGDTARTFWNLYGKSVELAQDLDVTMRDTGGMISPLFRSGRLYRLIAHFAQDPDLAPRIADCLGDWQDGDDLKRLNGAEAWDYRSEGLSFTPRNSYIQSLSELKLVKNFNQDLFDAIEPYLAYWPENVTNYLTMPAQLLYIILNDDDLAGRILELRDQGRLSSGVFTALTGIRQDMDNVFYPSGNIEITVNARHETARSQIRTIVSKKPAGDKPYTILCWQR